MTADQRPGDIKNYAAIRDTPLVLGGGARRARRRHPRPRAAHRGTADGRDLAVLKALGLTRFEVLRAVGWEATAFAAVALVVGSRWACSLAVGLVPFHDAAGWPQAPTSR